MNTNKKGGPNWNTTACLTKTNKPHYVNKYSKVIENDKYKQKKEEDTSR